MVNTLNLKEGQKITAIIVGVLIYALLNAYLTVEGIYYLLALPVLAGVFVLLVSHPKWLFFTLVLITPFSFLLRAGDQLTVAFPTEPIIWALMVLYILRQIHDPTLDKRWLKHPLTIIILIHFIWMFIACFTSTLPLVSFKFFLARFWYVVVFFFLALDIFRNYANIRRFLWLYILGMALVIIYANLNHATIGFGRATSHLAAKPFFKDHTIYGATVALFVPIVAGFFLRKRPFGNSSKLQMLSGLLTPLFLAGLFFSFSRAAWVSVVVALAGWFIFWLRIKFRTILIAITLVVSLTLIFWTQIMIFFQENEAKSTSGFVQNIKSIYNITSDASNTERINRWHSAYRMFKEKPVFGFGPGTYQFKYAPFQRNYQRTRISTNFGNIGNAHSEYLGPLAEYGFLGMLSKVALMLMTVYTGMRLYYKGENETVRITALMVLLAMLTYFTHGFLNNFLNYDKASVPFWAFLAIFVALDTYYDKPLTYFRDHSEAEDEHNPEAIP